MWITVFIKNYLFGTFSGIKTELQHQCDVLLTENKEQVSL